MKHSVAELTYRFLDGIPDLEPLQILAVCETNWLTPASALRVSFAVLGASHAVTFSDGVFAGAELLTCLPPRQAFHAHVERPADLPQHFSLCLPRFSGRVNLVPFALADGDTLTGAYAAENQLAVAFPAESGSATPITRIGWQFSGRLLTVETVHTYPEEGRGLRSTSVFELEDTNP